MFKRCNTYGQHFNKKNSIWGRIPYLYLRKNTFYCRIETDKINGKRKFLRFSLHTTSYYEAREMVKNILDMDTLFMELKDLYDQLNHKYEFVSDDNTKELKPVETLDDNTNKELLKKLHTSFKKCYNIQLDSLIEYAHSKIDIYKDLVKLKPDSLYYQEEIRDAQCEKQKWKNRLSKLKEYKETFQKVEALIPQIQVFLSPAYHKNASEQINYQNIPQIPSTPTNMQNSLLAPSLPNIGKLIQDMALKKNNSQTRREQTLLESLLSEIGISVDDDYSKLYDADIITELGKIIQNRDLKGSVKAAHRRFLSDLISYASIRSGKYYTTDYIELLPIFKKTKKSETEPHLAYKENQLVMMFDPKYNFFKENPDIFWICLIGLYTGSRTRAACTPQFKDIVTIDGIICIDINLNHKIKRVKNDMTIRKVPVHPDLINLGFLDYIKRQKDKREADDDDFIFPRCQTKSGNFNGHLLERSFFEFLRELGIKKEKVRKQQDNTDINGNKHRKKSTSDGHDFHSFRKNANLALIDAHVDRTYINQIIGWEGRDVREISYSEHELIGINEVYKKLHYDFLRPAFAEWKKIMATK